VPEPRVGSHHHLYFKFDGHLSFKSMDSTFNPSIELAEVPTVDDLCHARASVGSNLVPGLYLK
jgi:hypothetical protein